MKYCEFEQIEWAKNVITDTLENEFIDMVTQLGETKKKLEDTKKKLEDANKKLSGTNGYLGRKLREATADLDQTLTLAGRVEYLYRAALILTGAKRRLALKHLKELQGRNRENTFEDDLVIGGEE